jgi:hypothetical protein
MMPTCSGCRDGATFRDIRPLLLSNSIPASYTDNGNQIHGFEAVVHCDHMPYAMQSCKMPKHIRSIMESMLMCVRISYIS